MKRLNQMWTVLFIFSLGFFLFFGGVALVKVWKFFSFDSECPAIVSRFEVISLPSCRFGIAAHYGFEVKRVRYEGKMVFETPRFLSRFAAEHEITAMARKTWRVSYRQLDPSVSTLEKKFPYKACLEALVTAGVCLYFYSAPTFKKFNSASVAHGAGANTPF